jgi:hypothetical protein
LLALLVAVVLAVAVVPWLPAHWWVLLVLGALAAATWGPM